MSGFDILWSPWRMQYIQAALEPGGCFLCEKSGQEAAQDRENLILYRGARAFIIMNLYPYNPGHLMVAPYDHRPNLTDLAPEVRWELMELLTLCLKVLAAGMRPDGYNLGGNIGRVSGAGVADHVHLHVVPRWEGDTNFMPILNQTRVIPEGLLTTYDRLKPLFEAMARAS